MGNSLFQRLNLILILLDRIPQRLRRLLKGASLRLVVLLQIRFLLHLVRDDGLQLLDLRCVRESSLFFLQIQKLELGVLISHNPIISVDHLLFTHLELFDNLLILAQNGDLS